MSRTDAPPVDAITGFRVFAIFSSSVQSVMSELAMTVFVYIFAVFVLGGIHRRLVGPLRSDF